MQNSEKRRRVLFPIRDVCTTANLKLYGRRVRQIARVDFVKSQYARSLQSIHSTFDHHAMLTYKEEAKFHAVVFFSKRIEIRFNNKHTISLALVNPPISVRAIRDFFR